MKVKKSWLIVAFIGLVLSIFVLSLGISSVTAFADTGASEVQTSQSEVIADESNSTVKEWTAVIIGSIDTLTSLGIIAALISKKKQSVAVTVNDAQTQEKLEAIHNENLKLKEVLVAMLTLEKGTLDVLKALYADNPNLDDKVRNIINEISINSEDVIKDVKDIFDKANSEKVKQVFESVSNIILG